MSSSEGKRLFVSYSQRDNYTLEHLKEDILELRTFSIEGKDRNK